MTTQDHYSLRWNNHQNHILRAFDTLLQTKTLVDVTLVCAETSIRAHKMVLSACSPFFQRVFAETPCKHPVIVLKDFRGWVVQAIVDFMYRGEISVPQERLQTLIQAGESLQVRGLVENSVPENTPTPAASPDDFGMLDASLLSSELGRCSSYDEDCPTMVSSSGAKLMMQPHMFSSPEINHHNGSTGNHLNNSRSELCTSPMPRRKQARPRRRSGDCAPQDNNNSKPGTPIVPENTDEIRSDDDNEEFDEDEDDEHIGEDTEEINDKNIKDKHLNSADEHENHISDELNDNENDHDMTNDPIEQSNYNRNIRENSSSEVPENLCTKKSKKDDSDLNDENPINNNNNLNNNNNNNNNNNSNSNNNNRIVLSLKDIRHLNKQASISRSPNHHPFPQPLIHHDDHHHRIRSIKDVMKSESVHDSIIGGSGGGGGRIENDRDSSPIPFDQIDLSMAAAAAAAAQHHHHHQQQMNNNFLGAAAAANAVAHHHSQQQQHHRDKMERLEESLANRLNKEFTPSSPMSLPSHFNHPDGPQHPPSPLPFPGMSSALALTPPHMFGLDSPLGLFPPGMDPVKLYNPLMEMSDPRGMPNDHPPFLKKKMPRPKGQHSAPRGGPPRSWTNAELTEALQHVWNKKMTTSQASRIFGIPYNSLLMYVRGKYGKSLKLEQLRKDCISGPPIELLTMGMTGGSGGGGGGGGNGGPGGSNSGGGNSSNSKNINETRNKELKDLDASMQRLQQQTEAELLQGPNPLFNPFPPGFYPDFSGGFPGLPLGMLNLLPPERGGGGGGHPGSSSLQHLNMIDEDCKSDRSKQSLDDNDFPLSQQQQQQHQQQLNRDLDRREMLMQQNGQD